MQLFKEAYVTIGLEENGMLVMDWMGVPTTEQFKAGHMEALNHIREKHPKVMMFNFRDMAAWLDLDTQVWAINQWFSSAIEAGVNKLAVVIPSKVMAQIVVKSIFTGVSAKYGGGVEVGYFDTQAELNKWLTGHGYAAATNVLGGAGMGAAYGMEAPPPPPVPTPASDLFFRDPVMPPSAPSPAKPAAEEVHDDPFDIWN